MPGACDCGFSRDNGARNNQKERGFHIICPKGWKLGVGLSIKSSPAADIFNGIFVPCFWRVVGWWRIRGQTRGTGDKNPGREIELAIAFTACVLSKKGIRRWSVYFEV